MSDEGVIYLHGPETTVRSILADALNRADTFTMVIVVGLTEDGEYDALLIGHSDGDLAQKAGVCTAAAHKFANEMLNGT
jgi:hypothetical protein